MNWWKRRGWFSKVLLIAAALIVVLVIITSGGDDNKTAATTPATVANAPAVTPATTPTAPATTIAPKPAAWVEVAKLSGKTQKTGDVFELTGAPARMTYDITEGFTVVYVMADGKNLAKDGGLPDVTSTDALKDSTRLMRDAGKYYLVVNAATPYTVTVEEQR